ncbi:MAG TPA: nucleotide exchange factor GrpE [Isosphaeraceae bacterium]|nr:nucleotide exchange factor GrpE [Isosphaeraceae bacterium]
MNDRVDVEAVLDRFRRWLDAARALADDQGGLEPGLGLEEDSTRDFGVIDLVEEFTALRHEVKLQTKSGRGLIEQTETAVSALRLAIEQLRAVGPREAQATWAAGKALAEALADVDEALDRGHREIDRARQRIADESIRELEAALNDLHRSRSWIRRRLLRAYHNEVLDVVRRDGLSRHDLFDSLIEGFGLIQNRLGRVMASEQVKRIPCEGNPVDLALMTVLEVVHEPDQPPGTVVKELRRGYTWRGRVIRYAEVQAVRGSLISSPASGEPAPPEWEQGDFNVETEAVSGPVWLDSD